MAKATKGSEVIPKTIEVKEEVYTLKLSRDEAEAIVAVGYSAVPGSWHELVGVSHALMGAGIPSVTVEQLQRRRKQGEGGKYVWTYQRGDQDFTN